MNDLTILSIPYVLPDLTPKSDRLITVAKTKINSVGFLFSENICFYELNIYSFLDTFLNAQTCRLKGVLHNVLSRQCKIFGLLQMALYATHHILRRPWLQVHFMMAAPRELRVIFKVQHSPPTKMSQFLPSSAATNMTAAEKMANIDGGDDQSPCKRKPRSLLPPLEKKRRKAERNRRTNISRICIGDEIWRWTVLRKEMNIASNAELARVLLDSFEASGQVPPGGQQITSLSSPSSVGTSSESEEPVHGQDATMADEKFSPLRLDNIKKEPVDNTSDSGNVDPQTIEPKQEGNDSSMFQSSALVLECEEDSSHLQTSVDSNNTGGGSTPFQCIQQDRLINGISNEPDTNPDETVNGVPVFVYNSTFAVENR